MSVTLSLYSPNSISGFIEVGGKENTGGASFIIQIETGSYQYLWIIPGSLYTWTFVTENNVNMKILWENLQASNIINEKLNSLHLLRYTWIIQ